MKGPRVVNATPRARWVYGWHAVVRRLEVTPDELEELCASAAAARRLRERADAAGVALRVRDARALRERAGSDAHQGVVARTGPFRYGVWTDIETVAAERAPLLALDQVQDPHNLGALIRTALAAGVRAVLLPRHGTAPVTPAVEKVAAGAVNDLRVVPVTNLSRALEDLRGLGYWSVGLVPRGGENLFRASIPDPTVLVLGGESGLRRLVESRCDVPVCIPMVGPVESLNASVAGALAMYELLRRRS